MLAEYSLPYRRNMHQTNPFAPAIHKVSIIKHNIEKKITRIALVSIFALGVLSLASCSSPENEYVEPLTIALCTKSAGSLQEGKWPGPRNQSNWIPGTDFEMHNPWIENGTYVGYIGDPPEKGFIVISKATPPEPCPQAKGKIIRYENGRTTIQIIDAQGKDVKLIESWIESKRK